MKTNRIPLAPPKSAAELLDMYYLEMRCNLLEAAASFDRIQRAEGGEEALRDPRAVTLRQSLAILSEEQPGRAERFLDLFSVDEETSA